MSNMRLNPDGLAKLLIYAFLGIIGLMLAPLALKAIWWFVRTMSNVPDWSGESELAGTLLWTVLIGICLGVVIRLCRRI